MKPEYYECFMCKHYKTESKLAIRKHIRRHRKYSKCEVCSRRSLSSSHLCGENTEDVQCEYCSKRFKSTAKMQQHLEKLHKTNLRLYGCDKCSKFFPMIFFKNCHRASHTKKHVFKCDRCPKVFLKRTLLMCHKKTHQSVRCNLFYYLHFCYLALDYIAWVLIYSSFVPKHSYVKSAVRLLIRLQIWNNIKNRIPRRQSNALYVQRNFPSNTNLSGTLVFTIT